MTFLSNQRAWRIVLFALLGLLAFVAYWPQPVDQPVQGALTAVFKFLHRHGIPHWVDYELLEASANIALFIPIGFASCLAFPKKSFWLIGAFGLGISACLELGQLLCLHNRFPSPLDLVTNTSGAVIGAALAAVVLRSRVPSPCGDGTRKLERRLSR
ncbi:VanZ family protein [Pseudarthrobacter sp. NPDC092419]|uniref:VanZ family protein n=1 Tax=Pseudarthrobacter sp. NPDC092419 TaxID=3364414 RepID=UPI0038046D8B